MFTNVYEKIPKKNEKNEYYILNVVIITNKYIRIKYLHDQRKNDK